MLTKFPLLASIKSRSHPDAVDADAYISPVRLLYPNNPIAAHEEPILVEDTILFELRLIEVRLVMSPPANR
jgi:hypothetical protein